MYIAFTSEFRAWLEDFGVLLGKLERGGFALVAIASLEGSPTVFSKNYVLEERRALIIDNLAEDKLLEELDIAGEEIED